MNTTDAVKEALEVLVTKHKIALTDERGDQWLAWSIGCIMNEEHLDIDSDADGVFINELMNKCGVESKFYRRVVLCAAQLRAKIQYKAWRGRTWSTISYMTQY